MKTYILYIFLFLISSCQTVTISPDGKKTTLSSTPTYERSHNFFLWGLVGESNINVEEICTERSVKQMQTQQTFVNGLLSKITLGIYTPRTAKVWCEK